jgi:hypothetical protein
MSKLSSLILVPLFVALPATAQKRSAPKQEPTFVEAVETAKKAFDAKEHAAAVSALQAAIRAVQKLQRVAILEALPKPEGWETEDDAPAEDAANNPFAAGATAFGMTVQRHYRKGDEQRIDLEVIANTPLVSMFSMVLANPAMLQADGGELVEYGAHKAMLKKNGDKGLELTIVMHDKHIVKATSDALSADELLKIVDQALVDRLEKPLGK